MIFFSPLPLNSVMGVYASGAAGISLCLSCLLADIVSDFTMLIFLAWVI